MNEYENNMIESEFNNLQTQKISSEENTIKNNENNNNNLQSNVIKVKSKKNSRKFINKKYINNEDKNSVKSNENLLFNQQENLNLYKFQKKYDKNEKLCRICLKSENETNKFINICSCFKLNKFVHEECLNKKIIKLFNDKFNEIIKCDLCGDEYYIKFFLKYVYNSEKRCSIIKKIIFEFFLYIILFTIAVIIIGLIFYLFILEKNRDRQIFMICLSSVAFIIIIIIIISNHSNCKIKSCDVIVNNWKIMNLEEIEKLNENKEENVYVKKEIECKNKEFWYLNYIKDYRQLIYLEN